jgi:hypothetical protein
MSGEEAAMEDGASRLTSWPIRSPLQVLAVAVLALVTLGAAAHFAWGQDFGAPSGIPPSSLFDDRDLASLIRTNAEEWLPPTPGQIASRRAEPEDEGLRANFGIWLAAFVAPRWLPSGLAESAPYLRTGTGRESQAFSCFYAAYRNAEAELMVKGYAGRVVVTILPDLPSTDASPMPAFSKARSLQEALPPGRLGAPSLFAEATPALRQHLRELAERYLNPAVLPASEDWDRSLAHVQTYNGGFLCSWLTTGYTPYLPAGARHEAVQTLCTVWTNGVAARLTWELPFMPYAAPNLRASFPTPVRSVVAPLNPDAVEFWDMAQWRGADGPVDDPARAVTMVARVVVKAPYAPRVGVEEPGADANGQPSWGNEVNLPMTDLKWHIAEFAALAGATQMAVHYHGAPGPTALGAVLVASKDRARDLAQAKKTRDNLQAVADRFAALRYPPEVSAERDALLSALRDGVRAWDMTLAYWGPIVQQPASTDEAYYANCTARSERELREAGLWDTEDRIGAASDVAVPLLRKFGLQH